MRDGHDGVVVIGGGPAGSVAAAALAREGVPVRLIEGARFPRYHIGESLTPSCRAVLEAVGIADTLDKHGFTHKRGGVIHWGDDAWVFDWGSRFGLNSWQVDRAEFDRILLEHAVACGVDVRTGVTAREVAFADGRPAAVHCVTEDGAPFTLDGFGHLIDASGRNGLLGVGHLGIRRADPGLRNVAIWGYWHGAALLPQTPAGGINVISTPEGWYWVIPLAGGRTSIGYVTARDGFAARRPAFDSLEAMYLALADESAPLRSLLGDARHSGPVRVETDYSYTSERFCGPGYTLVGDAACFLDPLLSTGVHLALYSALNAAAGLASVHRGEVTEEQAAGFYEHSFRRAYTRLYALVNVMYERYLGRDGLFHVSDRLVGVEQGGIEQGGADPASARSFVEIISGISDLREAGDADTRVLTERLIAEARRAQERTIADPGGPGQPDFSSVLENPLRDAESADYRLVLHPRLGLAPVQRAVQPPSTTMV